MSNQFKEICFKNDKPLNIIKLATLDHIEWTAVNNANDCHHKSGTCIVGCMAGYQGNMCLKRVYIYKSTVKTTLSP